MTTFSELTNQLGAEQREWILAQGIATGLLFQSRSFFLAGISDDGRMGMMFPVSSEEDQAALLAGLKGTVLGIEELLAEAQDGTEDALDNQ